MTTSVKTCAALMCIRLTRKHAHYLETNREVMRVLPWVGFSHLVAPFSLSLSLPPPPPPPAIPSSKCAGFWHEFGMSHTFVLRCAEQNVRGKHFLCVPPAWETTVRWSQPLSVGLIKGLNEMRIRKKRQAGLPLVASASRSQDRSYPLLPLLLRLLLRCL